MNEVRETADRGPYEVVYVHGVAIGVGRPEKIDIATCYKMICNTLMGEGEKLTKKQERELARQSEANAKRIAEALNRMERER